MGSTHHHLAVRTATEQYDIHIGAGMVAQVGEHLTRPDCRTQSVSS